MKKLISILFGVLLCSLLVFGLQSPAQLTHRDARFDVRVDNVIVPIFDQDIDAKVGSSFEVNVYYANRGDKNKVILRVSTDEGNNFDKTILFRGVNWITGEIELGHQSFYPIFYTPGNHTFNVTIDPDNRVREWDEVNNQVVSQVFEVKDVHTVEGTVTQLFSMEDVNNESVIVNATVTVGEYSTTTDGNGHYYLEVPEAGQYQVTVNHPDYFERITYTEINSVESFDINMVPMGFPMWYYDEVARGEGWDPSVRWMQIPQVYISTAPASGSGIVPTIDQINFVNELFSYDDEIISITDAFFYGVNITNTSNPPPTNTPNSFIFKWDDTVGPSGGGGYISDDNTIISAFAKMRTSSSLNGYYRRNIARNTGGQILSNSYIPSILNSPVPEYFQFVDERMGKLLYSRPAGSISPDSDPNPLVRTLDNNYIQFVVFDNDLIYKQKVYYDTDDVVIKLNLDKKIKMSFDYPEGNDLLYNVQTKTISIKMVDDLIY